MLEQTLPKTYYMQKISESLQPKVKLTMFLQIDNQASVHLVNNSSVGGRTRHIDVSQRFQRKLKVEGGHNS